MPLNDSVLSTLRTGVEVSCKPPRVDAQRLLILLVCGNVRGSKVDCSPHGVPPPAWRYRPTNWSACNVTMISPLGRWNMCVFGRHRSTSAINTTESIIGILPVTSRASGRNPAYRMYDAYLSSHVRGLWVRILSG
jgi:hypothetical protein